MQKITKENLDPAVFEIYDNYAHSKMDRREFMDQLSTYAVKGMTVASLAAFLLPKYATAQQVQPDDPRLKTKVKKYKSPKGAGKMKGLLARPADQNAKLPGIIVVHENRGLNPHIEDVARRAALEGYIVFAPDALTPLGGYPGTDDEGKVLQRKRDKNEMLEDFIAGYEYLKNHKKCNGNVGVVGFCFGGWMSNMMAVHIPDLKASVPFYGGQPADEDVPKINASLSLHFGELDKRVNAGWPDYEVALKKHNKEYTAHMYPGANHGFHNDTTPRYDKEAAELAWKRTMDFFGEKLG